MDNNYKSNVWNHDTYTDVLEQAMKKEQYNKLIEYNKLVEQLQKVQSTTPTPTPNPRHEVINKILTKISELLNEENTPTTMSLEKANIILALTQAVEILDKHNIIKR